MRGVEQVGEGGDRVDCGEGVGKSMGGGEGVGDGVEGVEGVGRSMGRGEGVGEGVDVGEGVGRFMRGGEGLGRSMGGGEGVVRLLGRWVERLMGRRVEVGEDSGAGCGKVDIYIKRRRASSSFLSCNLRLLARFARRSRAKGGSNRMSVRCRTREQATNVRPDENSFLPMSTTTLSKVSPCAL